MSRAALIVVMILYAVAGCSAVSRTTSVSNEARAEVISSARLAHQAEELTQGKDPLQVLHLVLDLGVADPQEAAKEEARRLAASGWRVDPDSTSGPVSASSERVNATAAISTLTEFLAAPHSYESTVNDIRQKFPNATGLIVVSLEPMAKRS